MFPEMKESHKVTIELENLNYSFHSASWCNGYPYQTWRKRSKTFLFSGWPNHTSASY